MLQMHSEQYERALKVLASSDAQACTHYIFSVWRRVLSSEKRQGEFDAARERMLQMHNEQYERALKTWAMSDTKSLVHYLFSLWRDVVSTKIGQDRVDAARKSMAQTHTEQY